MTIANAKSPTRKPSSSRLDPEVQPITRRPHWSAAEKLAILQEYEAYPRAAPERGALLRRHGIYTSHISKWRQQRNRGALAALALFDASRCLPVSKAPVEAPALLPAPPAPAHPRALSGDERAQVRAVLNSSRFADCAPRTVYATLLDEQQYLCSWRTMYRILAEADELRERRNQVRRTGYAAPELLATAPNQLWSWDITKLRGPAKWTYYYLYVILDVFSRAVVGWLIAEREDALLAEALIAETCTKEGIMPEQLRIHADRGSAMTSKVVAQLLADLGVAKIHSRPHASDDNPFSEA